ncbi:hypothetical protein Rs2_46365 [Raphanus sativus]|nr:hypothetical protein Rs2_46365 [Raphanus sativus]
MASMINTVYLSEIHPFKNVWRVDVKVLHKWITLSHQYGASIEMVLSDQNDVKIHATCNQELMPQFDRQLTVGVWKVITNFQLRKACGIYRTTNHVYKMFFQTYILGQVLDLGGPYLVQCARKEMTKLKFTLRDIKNLRLHCCIMGRLAQMLIEEDSKLKEGDVFLIRFAKVCNYNDIKETEALKQMFHGEPNELQTIQPKSEDVQMHNKLMRWSQYPFTTIQGMKRLSKVFKPHDALDELNLKNWWCKICQCNVEKVLARYKLTLLVQYLIGESELNLDDSATTFIVKSSAAEVLDPAPNQAPINHQESLPPHLVDIVGKTYGFGICIVRTPVLILLSTRQ